MDHFWLNEGFTTWAERRILDALHGETASALRWAIGQKALDESVARFGPDSPLTRLRTDLRGVDPDEAFSSIPYEKGARFVVLLERHAGRETIPAVHAEIYRDFPLHFHNLGRVYRLPGAGTSRNCRRGERGGLAVRNRHARQCSGVQVQAAGRDCCGGGSIRRGQAPGNAAGRGLGFKRIACLPAAPAAQIGSGKVDLARLQLQSDAAGQLRNSGGMADNCRRIRL